MSAVKDAFRAWLDSDLVVASRNLLEAAFFRPNEPPPTSLWKTIVNPPMPYWTAVFSQTCRIISLLILLPILAMAVLDFTGYAVFRTLGLHRQRVRVLRQSGIKTSAVHSSSPRRKPRIYQTDRNRPTDRSNIPSIVKAPLLTPGTYDAETLLRQRARSLSVASLDEQEAWLASGGQQARLSTLSRDEASLASPESDAISIGELSSSRDYFARAPRVGVEGALGLPDTDADESGTESGRDSPTQRFPSSSRHRGLNFTPMAGGRPTSSQSLEKSKESAPSAATGDVYSASVASFGSNDSSLSNDGISPKRAAHDESSGSSSSWVGVEGDDTKGSTVPSLTIDPIDAAAAAGLESASAIFSTNSSNS